MIIHKNITFKSKSINNSNNINNKIKFPFIILIPLILLLIISPFIFKIDLTNNSNEVLPSDLKIKIINYFIPVVNFWSLKNNIELVDLASSNIVALNKDSDLIKELIPNGNIYFTDNVEFETKLNEGYIGLLKPEEVNFKYKTLEVNNINFWSNVNTDNYPLITTQEIYESEINNYPIIKEKYSMFFTGEIIPARAVDRLALNKNNNYTYMYDFFKDELNEANISIGLLENPISGNPKPCTGCMLFVGDEQNAKGLKDVGFDVLSLAGNHAGDGGQGAYQNTIKNLDDNGILHMGVGKNDYDKIKPAIINVNGKRIGFISADTVAGYYWLKGTNYWGTNWFSKESNSQVDYDRVRLITDIKTDNSIDYLVVYMSWGIEYTNKASNFQKELAHALIDNGVDLIVGSHPHWVQNIEIYNNKPIIYSLGNFLFDQNHTDPTRQGMNVMLYYYDNELKFIKLLPHLSCGPFISSNNITDEYLKGNITINDLYSRNERNGCVYFQPLELKNDNSVYKTIIDRVKQYSNF